MRTPAYSPLCFLKGGLGNVEPIHYAKDIVYKTSSPDPQIHTSTTVSFSMSSSAHDDPTLSKPTRFRPRTKSKIYLNSIQRQSCLASRDPASLATDLANYTLTAIRQAELWGQDPVLLTVVQNAHIGIPSIPDDQTSPLLYPEGPATVYRFMRSPDGEIDGTWDREGQYHPSGNIGCKPPWGMEDVPDSIVMRAAAMASRQLRNPIRLSRVQTSLEHMSDIITTMSNRPRQPSRIFLHVMASEIAACQEYISNKTAAEPSHQATNRFLLALDVMTARGPSICSDEYIREVPQHYFDRWDIYQWETEAAEIPYFDFLSRLDPRYGTIPTLQRFMTSATQPNEAGSVEPTKSQIAPFDYVGRYESMMGTCREASFIEDSESVRRAMLSRLAGELPR
jgi:hypothetical protein